MEKLEEKEILRRRIQGRIKNCKLCNPEGYTWKIEKDEKGKILSKEKIKCFMKHDDHEESKAYMHSKLGKFSSPKEKKKQGKKKSITSSMKRFIWPKLKKEA